MQRFYPWLVAVLVLIPALVAWQLQRTRHARDLARFRQEIGEQAPRLLASTQVCQDIANQVMKHVAKGGGDWVGFEPLGEWRLRSPATLGYGYALRTGEALPLARQTLRSGEPLHPPGADLLALPEVREAWEDMLRLGEGTLSRALPLLRDDPRPLVLVLRVVYTPGRLPPTEAERRAEARGLAFCIFDPETVWAEGMARLDRRALNVERLPEDAPDEKRDFVRTAPLSLRGHVWKARFTPGPEFFQTESRMMPALVAAVGVLLAAITFALARAQARRREEVEALNRGLDARVAALTEELRGENVRLRLAQEEAERALTRERETGELKSRMVATISHEFRTPLSVILSSADILRTYAGRLDEHQRAEHLAAIADSVGGMSALIQSVLTFSKAGAGRLEFHPERHAPEDLLREVVDEMHSATSRRCPIRLDCRGVDEPGWIDVTLLRLILVNLLGNAVKYSPPGSPVDLRARRVGDDLLFAVADRGIGIPEEDQKDLFQSFRRGRNTHGIPGTGLGLSIVKTCVDLHGGHIEVGRSPEATPTGTSATGTSGTVFTVTLPVYAALPSTPSTLPTAPAPAPASTQPGAPSAS